MTDHQPNPLDVLPELEAVHAAGGLGHRAHAALDRAIPEMRALRFTATAAQDAATRLLMENRELRARLAGHPVVRVMRVGAHDLPLPRYETDGAAGMDLRANLQGVFGKIIIGGSPPVMRLYPGERALIPCGFAFEIPAGFEGQVRGRSSLTKRGVLAPTGTIDSDYRGVVSTYVWNLSPDPIEIADGDRISQLIIAPAPQGRIEAADALSETVRGNGGYGSTGSR